MLPPQVKYDSCQGMRFEIVAQGGIKLALISLVDGQITRLLDVNPYRLPISAEIRMLPSQERDEVRTRSLNKLTAPSLAPRQEPDEKCICVLC